MSKKEAKVKNPRLGCVGGQAVLEGIMMKSKDKMSIAVRREDGEIAVKNSVTKSIRTKHKILGWPLIRGCVNFVETLIMSYSTLEDSAKLLGMDEIEEETKFDKWVKDKFGDKVMNVIMAIAAVIGVAIAIGLFFFLPKKLADLIFPGFGAKENTTYGENLVFSLVTGVIKIVIFIAYMLLVSLMKDIRRTFEYHGAEHKSIACYEAGVELTPANAKKYTRFHPRCGTSFIFVILILSILIFSIVPPNIGGWFYVLRLILLPLVVGVGYEFLMLSGKHPNKFTLALAAPGLLMQRITTKEPDEDMLEVAIVALKCALREEFPETYEYYENKAKEEKEAKEAEEAAESENTQTDEAAENETSDKAEAGNDAE